ncbi:general stress protein, partial [Ensifer sp.]|uniref:general stress protein n=1 Tax=Ensifer sp. TaxID=1872086 RepID=UPI00289F4698
MKTVSGLFDTYEQASQAVRDLKAAGIPDGDVSMVASNAEGRYKVDDTEGAAAGAGTGAGLGAAVGGAGGLLTGLGLMAIPGVGPVVEA